MHVRLPSLNALRVFESAARKKSFKAAAAELHVTQSAVSRQIKLLEDQMQAQLFWRFNRVVELTPAGETLLPCLSRAFFEIADVTGRISNTGISPTKSTSLLIAASPGIAECWLGSRFGDFIRCYPGIESEVAVLQSPLEALKAGRVEVAIQWDTGDWPEFHQTTLMEVTEFPVCSPSLLEEGPALLHPSDLKHHRLLHLSTRSSWADWLRTFEATSVNWSSGPVLRDVTLCMKMALSGEGVALGDEILAGDDLIQGRLVKPLRQSRTLERRMHLLIQRQAAQRDEVRAFEGWLLGQIDDHLLSTRALREDRPFLANTRDQASVVLGELRGRPPG